MGETDYFRHVSWRIWVWQVVGLSVMTGILYGGVYGIAASWKDIHSAKGVSEDFKTPIFERFVKTGSVTPVISCADYYTGASPIRNCYIAIHDIFQQPSLFSLPRLHNEYHKAKKKEARGGSFVEALGTMVSTLLSSKRPSVSGSGTPTRMEFAPLEKTITQRNRDVCGNKTRLPGERETCPHEIITQLTVDRMFRLRDLLHEWPGYISAALYTSKPIRDLKDVIIPFYEDCGCHCRRRLRLHLISGDPMRPYPINLLRNIGLNQSYGFSRYASDVFDNTEDEWRDSSTWAAIYDIDFIPNPKLCSQLTYWIHQRLQLNSIPEGVKISMEDIAHKQLLITPAFEFKPESVKGKDEMSIPSSKQSLIRMLDSEIVQRFHPRFVEGQYVDLRKWRHRRMAYPPEQTSLLNEWYCFFHVSTILRLSSRTSRELCDRDFFNRGFNKITCFLQMRLWTLEPFYLPESFVIHYPEGTEESNETSTNAVDEALAAEREVSIRRDAAKGHEDTPHQSESERGEEHVRDGEEEDQAGESRYGEDDGEEESREGGVVDGDDEKYGRNESHGESKSRAGSENDSRPGARVGSGKESESQGRPEKSHPFRSIPDLIRFRNRKKEREIREGGKSAKHGTALLPGEVESKSDGHFHYLPSQRYSKLLFYKRFCQKAQSLGYGLGDNNDWCSSPCNQLFYSAKRREILFRCYDTIAKRQGVGGVSDEEFQRYEKRLEYNEKKAQQAEKRMRQAAAEQRSMLLAKYGMKNSTSNHVQGDEGDAASFQQTTNTRDVLKLVRRKAKQRFEAYLKHKYGPEFGA